MIPKTQRFNALFGQEFFACFILLDPFGQTVLKTVKFNVQFGVGTIKIQNVNSKGVLPSKFEPGETMAAQCQPELFFLISLVAAKPAGSLG
jgi:hypothetical protein